MLAKAQYNRRGCSRSVFVGRVTFIDLECNIVSILQSAGDSRQAGITYHLSLVDVWSSQEKESQYLPEAYDNDGFIHCTDGLENLLDVGNMFYTADPRDFCVLVLNTSAIESEIRYEDPDEVFPHVYGPLNTDAVVGYLRVIRGENGAFISFEQ
jgi:uncharacterized protein (DUF952 family)